MKLELGCEQLDAIVKEKLLDNIEDFEKMLIQNYEYHFGDIVTFVPLYSWNYDEECKKLRKMLKSLIKVYNHYSETKYRSDD